jgi:hypothetical protein
MPKGPNGERRPADAVSCAVMVGRIATGDQEDEMPTGRRVSGLAGAAARVAKTTATERREVARRAAEARWGR